MGQNEDIKVIKTLDNPLRFLFWEYTNVLFCSLFFMMGLIGSRSLIFSLILSAVSLLIYTKIRKRLFRHFKRFSYWTFFSKNTKALPHSHKRNFIH